MPETSAPAQPAQTPLDVLRKMQEQAEELNARLLQLATEAALIGSEERQAYIANCQRLAADQAQLYRTLTTMIDRVVAVQVEAQRAASADGYHPGRRKKDPDEPMYG